jgi:sugar lactone lactonase YvrE
MSPHQLPVNSAARPLLPSPLLLLGAILFCFLPAPAVHAQGVTFGWAQTTLTKADNPNQPTVDSSGNVFFSDPGMLEIDELVAVNGSIPANPTLRTLTSGFTAYSLAVDGSGNIFFTNATMLNEIEAVNGSIPSNPTIRTLASGLVPAGLAVDGSGDVFVSDIHDEAVKEIVAVNGSIPNDPTIRTLGSGSFNPSGVAVDANGDVFVADGVNDVVKEIEAVNGSVPANPVIRTVFFAGSGEPDGIVVDTQGDVFITTFPQTWITEILAVNGSIPSGDPAVIAVGNKDSQPDGLVMDQNGNLFVAGFALTEGYIGTRLAEVQLGPVDFGSVEVCPSAQTTADSCSRSITLTYNVAAGTTIGGVNILTAGAKNLDFQAALATTAASCAAQTYPSAATCTVDVTFAPLASGVRNGTVQIVDDSGNVLATTPIYGIGPNQTITFAAILKQSVGSSVALTATASSGLPVTFGSGTPQVCTVSGTTATMLYDGFCSLTATQGGNASYLAVIAGQTFAVGLVDQTIDFPTIPPQIALTPLDHLYATASSGQHIAFNSKTPEVCAVTGIRVDFLTAGSCDVVASVNGNAEYFPAITGQTFLVHHRSQVITFDSIAAQPVNTMFPLTASSDSELAITYASTTPTVCTVSGSTASLLKAGTCTIQASQAGDATWFPSGPKTVSLTVE